MKLPASRKHAIGAGILAIGLLAAIPPVAFAEDAATVRLSIKDPPVPAGGSARTGRQADYDRDP